MKKVFFYSFLYVLVSIPTLALATEYVTKLTIKIAEKNPGHILQVKIFVSQPYSATKWRVVELPAFKQTVSLSVVEDQPRTAYMQVLDAGQPIANSELFILSGADLEFVINTETEEVLVVGGENDFFFKNRYLYLGVPALIALHPNYKRLNCKRFFELGSSADRTLDRMNREYENFVLAQVGLHCDLFFTLYQLNEVREGLSTSTLERAFFLVKEEYRSTDIGLALANYIENSKHLFYQMRLPTFEVYDSAMVAINSNNLYGHSKYTLIDVWASWCVPCRAQMIEYGRETSFDSSLIRFVYVSLDDDINKWKNAMEKDMAKGLHLIDIREWNSEIVKSLLVDGIPYNILLDQEGRIVEKNVSIDHLKELFKDR